MESKPLLSHRGRVWLMSPLGALNRWMGQRSRWLILVGSLVLLWWLQRAANLSAIAAGIAIFLFGLFFLEQGFSQLASVRWRKGIRRWTSSLPHAVGFGAVAAVMTQSSALVGLLTLSFLSARMIEFVAGIGILAGATIGTTSGGWLLAAWGLKVSIGQYALPLLVLGMLLISMPRWGTRGIGMVISGGGFLFLGIDYIRGGFTAISSVLVLQQLALPGWNGLILCALAGMLVTLVLQSSHASLLLVMVALNTGQLDYDVALALTLGINVGATSPVLLGAMNSSIEGKRLAWLDLGFKMVTMLLCLVLFYPFRWFTDRLGDLCGLAESELALRLALYHSLFNLLAVSWMLPLRHRLTMYLQRWWPEHRSRVAVQARYLDRVVAAHPATAEQALLRELLHLLMHCQDTTARAMLGLSRQTMLAHAAVQTVRLGEDLPSVSHLYQQTIKPLFGEIIRFAALCKSTMTQEQGERIDSLVAIARSMTEAVRLERQLQANLLEVFAAEDPLLVQRYRGLQHRLLWLQQAIHALMTSQELQPHYLSRLESMAARIDVESKRDREDIEWLIRSDKLDAIAAATLMHDVLTLRRLQRQQIKATRCLLTTIFQQQNGNSSQLVEWLNAEEQLGLKLVA
ncbi:Na/Pi cotransporter family protein [Pseudaeromonas sharmana]|uniref:Na/Pi cotransporter family protein n=1 Tax=Pseudaeromonas sharmana TaxID=328412 RepID=A0ABV8CK96_9GAMM